MENNLNTLKKQIEMVLRDYPDTRNSDKLLTWKLWKQFYSKSLYTYITMDEFFKLPTEDTIKRIRAKIQNTDFKYLPTYWEIAKQRRWRESKWRSFLETDQTK
jgi:hypothetical protein